MSVQLKENEVIFLKENFDNAEKLIESSHVNDILDPLDALITYKGFDYDYSLTAWGRKAQDIYDNIYYSNVD